MNNEMAARVLDSRRSVSIGHCESQFRWMTSALKRLAQEPHPEDALSLAHNACQFAQHIAEVFAYNNALDVMQKLLANDGGSLPSGIEAHAIPKLNGPQHKD